MDYVDTLERLLSIAGGASMHGGQQLNEIALAPTVIAPKRILLVSDTS